MKIFSASDVHRMAISKKVAKYFDRTIGLFKITSVPLPSEGSPNVNATDKFFDKAGRFSDTPRDGVTNRDARVHQ